MESKSVDAGISESSAKTAIERGHIEDWVAETDAQIHADLDDIEDQEPTIFDDSGTILSAVEKAARLAGKREILDDIKEKLRQTDQTET